MILLKQVDIIPVEQCYKLDKPPILNNRFETGKDFNPLASW